MKRRIIQIDEEKCNGCGACAKACHEGAIGMVDGKKRNCCATTTAMALATVCPHVPWTQFTLSSARPLHITEAAVLAAKAHKAAHTGCPGARMRQMNHGDAPVTAQKRPSQLSQWPCQIKLAPVNAPYFDGCELLIAADCTAYAYASIHEDFMRGKITLIGCPKLDAVDYSHEARRDFRAERCSQRDASSHGGSVLRGTRICGKEGHRRKRQGAFSSRGDDLDRGRNSRGHLIFMTNMLE